MAKEIKHIGDLVPDKANLRKHSPRNIGMVADALNEVGAARSIVIDEDGTILAGNGVVEAAAQAGIEKVQVVEADGETIIAVRRSGLTERQKKRLALFDNRTSDTSEFDLAILAELREQDAKLLEGLWHSDELDELLAGLGSGEDVPEDPGAQTDRADELRDKWGTARGQLWQVGRHRLMCGDSTSGEDVARLMGGEPADLMLTDPPYCSGGFQEAGRKSGSIGTRGDEMIANDMLSTRGYTALIKSVLLLSQTGLIYVFTDWRMWVNLFDLAESSGYGVRNMIVWDKGTPGMGVGWRSQHELILCGMRVSHSFNPHKAQGNVIQAMRTGNVQHPTEKPVDLLCKILDVNDLARTVSDPFMGSGSVMVACEQGGRVGYGMELSPAFLAVALQRMADMGLEPRLLCN